MARGVGDAPGLKGCVLAAAGDAPGLKGCVLVAADRASEGPRK